LRSHKVKDKIEPVLNDFMKLTNNIDKK